jgi:hypothetical protein
MIELRFASDLYSGVAIDAAVKVYSEWAKFDLERRAEEYVVRVSAIGSADETAIADELANYALGLTIEQHRAEHA